MWEATRVMTKPTSRLQAELKKRSPFETPTREVWLNLMRTTSQLQIEFERLFASFGLTSPQYNVLRILRGKGQPLPILEIAHRMIVVVPGITGLLDRLEKAGLVLRERCTQDRRVIYTAITDAAQQLLGRIDLPLQELYEDAMRPLDQSEQGELVRLLEKLQAGTEDR